VTVGITAADIIVFLAGVIVSTLGLYGLFTSKNIVRLLVSIEVLFNSIILEAAYIGYLAGLTPGFYSLLIVVISLTITEIAIVVALVALAYRRKKGLGMELFEEARG
jgi:NAD(P)H-quinone oxidoreductase subunit 4L